nr:hypothetical protein [uncultured Prevotella sp.]
MKHVNSISQIKIDRDLEIIRFYQQAKRMVEWPTTTAKICEYVSRMPTECYYISFDAAYSYVRKRLKGIIPSFGIYHQQKKVLFEAFFQEYQDLAAHYREQGKKQCVYNIVELALERPAPNLGLSAKYIQGIISAHFKNLKSSHFYK